jgi:cell filamentation protein
MVGDRYVYPGTNVLRNRFEVRDAGELARREAATTVRIAELAERPIPGAYDLEHLQAVHRHISGDVYDWAGGDPHGGDREGRSVRAA